MDPLHYVGFSEEYVETPATVKRQLGIAVTKEAIFFDRTGLVLDRAGYVGTILGLRKEKNLLGVMIGAVNTYKEKRTGDSAAVSLKTFYAADDNGRWVNHLDGNGAGRLDEHQRRRAAVRQIVDPNTGEPIILPGTRLILAPQIQFLALNQILHGQPGLEADAERHHRGRTASAGPNPLQNLNITMATSRQLYKQLQVAARPGRGHGRPATGSTATRRPSPTWRTGRSPWCRPRPTARPSSARTSWSASRPASEARRPSSSRGGGNGTGPWPRAAAQERRRQNPNFLDPCQLVWQVNESFEQDVCIKPTKLLHLPGERAGVVMVRNCFSR